MRRLSLMFEPSDDILGLTASEDVRKKRTKLRVVPISSLPRSLHVASPLRLEYQLLGYLSFHLDRL